MIPRDAFPRLTDRNYRVTSPETADYNCGLGRGPKELVAGVRDGWNANFKI